MCLRVLRVILKKVVNAFLRCRITFCLKMTSSKVIDFQYIITRKLSYKFEIYHKFYCKILQNYNFEYSYFSIILFFMIRMQSIEWIFVDPIFVFLN